MSNHQTKTNNDLSLIDAKIQLRLMSLPEKNDVLVLEAFGGEGILWREEIRNRWYIKGIMQMERCKYFGSRSVPRPHTHAHRNTA